MKYRKKALSTFYNVAKFIPLDWMKSISRQQIILPFYHLATDVVPDHIKYLYTPKTLAEFEEDLDFLLKHFSPLTLEEFRTRIYSPDKKYKPGFFLTFDDGLSEFYVNIAPILIRKGIPAAVFVNPSFVDNRDLFYRYKVSLLLSHLERSPKKWLQPKIVQMMNNLTGGNNFAQKLLSVDYRNKSILDTIAQNIGLNFDTYLNQHAPYMTKAQLLSIKDAGFYIGGHSMDHPRYELISLQEQIHQTQMSVNWVSEELGCNDRIFAFPFTDYKVKIQFFENLNKDGLMTFGTAGLKNDTQHNHFQRIPMEHHKQLGSSVIKYEYLYYIFKSFVGKNTIRR